METDASIALARYLSMDETELLIELARLETADPQLRSPEALLEEAKAYLARIRPKLQVTLCPHRHLADLPEMKLALALAGLLAGSFAGSLATILAAYIVKRGLLQLCADWSSDA